MALKDKPKKTHSQRLRAVLYKAWEQDNKGFESHEDHYEHHMEKLIEFSKKRLLKDEK